MWSSYTIKNVVKNSEYFQRGVLFGKEMSLDTIVPLNSSLPTNWHRRVSITNKLVWSKQSTGQVRR